MKGATGVLSPAIPVYPWLEVFAFLVRRLNFPASHKATEKNKAKGKVQKESGIDARGTAYRQPYWGYFFSFPFAF